MLRVPLATLPTPLERLDRLSESLGIDLWCKRDDLTGVGLSGNKVRKLEYLLGAATDEGATAVITTGGAQSNHARTTALAARRLGLDPILLLRGPPPPDRDGNLLLSAMLGAEVHWCTPEAYRRERNELMAALAETVASRGGRAYVIPEGGTNAVGSFGYVQAARELASQTDQPFEAIVLAVGSAGTLAGLALGPDLGPLHGVAVSDDAPTFEAAVHRVHLEASSMPAFDDDPRPRWRVVEGYQGEAYGVTGPEVWQTMAWVAEVEGLLLDPVYTGKAFHALVEEVRAGRMGGRVLFWHTGGVFGLFGRGGELPS